MPVHLRINDKDTSRNPYINFVTALPGPRHDEALRRLQQLAAMVKPLMKDQGFHINSLEEFEFNREFAGRCWENGEVIELVLTGEDGSWRPLQFVLYVFCHELAHIKHMNHIPHLHGALTRHLKQLALTKQSEGYFGDGLWSSGRQLQGGGFKSGLGMNQGQQDLPQQVCGGAFRRPRAQKTRRGRRRGHGGKSGKKFTGPSLHTGAQTASNTRGGNRRVKLGVKESSGGNRVDGKDWFPVASSKNQDYKLDQNSTFRKRTQSKEAREKRASAALARLANLQGNTVKSEAGVAIIKTEVKRELFKKEESIKDEEQEEGGRYDTDSVTEDDGSDDDDDDDDDTWLVGNDMGEEQRPKIKEENDYHAEGESNLQQQQFTQADQDETSEQRQRRMQRFDQKHGSGLGTSTNDNDWQILLEDGPAKRKVKEENSGDESDVVLVEGPPPGKRSHYSGLDTTKSVSNARHESSSGIVPQSSFTPVAASKEWSECSVLCKVLMVIPLSSPFLHPSSLSLPYEKPVNSALYATHSRINVVPHVILLEARRLWVHKTLVCWSSTIILYHFHHTYIQESRQRKES